MVAHLEDGIEPCKEEVEASSLVGLSAHAGRWDGAEGADEIGSDARGRLEGEDPRGTQQVDRNLCPFGRDKTSQ